MIYSVNSIFCNINLFGFEPHHEKTLFFWVSDQVRYKPSSTTTEDGSTRGLKFRI